LVLELTDCDESSNVVHVGLKSRAQCDAPVPGPRGVWVGSLVVPPFARRVQAAKKLRRDVLGEDERAWVAPVAEANKLQQIKQ
jgi:hypothetical protein